MTRIVTCYYGKLNMAKRIYKKYQVSLNTSNIWDNSPKSDILLKTYIRKTPTIRRSDVRICQLVPVSNLDHFLPGAADAVSIKNRWHSAKGWYSAMQTPWRQGAEKKKWYSAVQPRGGTVQVPWCGVLKSNVKMPSCSLHLWEATAWQVQSPREKSTKPVLYHQNMKMHRSQLLSIVLLLAPLASAITLQTDLIEGSFKIKVTKKNVISFYKCPPPPNPKITTHNKEPIIP